MNFIKQNSGVIAVVALVIAIIGWALPSASQNIGFGATNQCASGQTCLPSIELTGPNSGVTNAFQVDSGISTFAGAVTLTSSFTLGSSGTAQVNQVSVTCSMKADVASLGTTTQTAFCTGVTGLTSADNVFAQFATSSTAIADNWIITGAKASTTAGAVDFRIEKMTGVAASQAMSAVTTIGSTTILWISH